MVTTVVGDALADWGFVAALAVVVGILFLLLVWITRRDWRRHRGAEPVVPQTSRRSETAADAAASVVAAIPRRSHLQVVDLSTPSRAAFRRGQCPICGRSVGFTIGLMAGGWMPTGGLERTPTELEAACLLHGLRRRSARQWTPAEIVAAAATVRDGLAAAGWDRWADIVTAAVDDEVSAERIEQVGLALDALRSFGPVSLPPDAPVERDRADDPRTRADQSLDTLVASSAPFWPSRPRSDGG